MAGVQPIDPCRRVQFDTAHPEYISPLAIRVLTENEGVLKLFGMSSSSVVTTHSPRAAHCLPDRADPVRGYDRDARAPSVARHRVRQFLVVVARGDAGSTRGYDWVVGHSTFNAFMDLYAPTFLLAGDLVDDDDTWGACCAGVVFAEYATVVGVCCRCGVTVIHVRVLFLFSSFDSTCICDLC